MNTSNYNFDPQEADKKIFVGTATIYLILAVSLGASLAYWFVLSGAGENQGLSSMWQVLLWLLVLTGLVAEIIKKVTLSTFRHKNIWLTATFVSVFTVMGTYSIMDSNRQDTLNKESDQYQDSRSQRQTALNSASGYAWAKGFDLQALEAEKTKIVHDRAKRRIKYADYLHLKKEVQNKIEAKRNYEGAMNSAGMASEGMSNTGSSGVMKSNPLLSNISYVIHLNEALIKMAFYLLVTLLLEITAYWLGGKVEEERKMKKMTETEILDMKNKAVFGLSVKDMQEELFEKVNQAIQDRGQAEKEIKRLRKERKQRGTNEMIPSPEIAQETKQIRKKAQTQIKESRTEAHAKNNEDYQGTKAGFITSPTPTISPINVPIQAHNSPFTVPKQAQPKYVAQNLSCVVPKKAQETRKNRHNSNTLKRKSVTPDTGTTGKNSKRYQALKKRIIVQGLKPTMRNIQGFKYGGRGMGRSTAEKYRDALRGEGII